MDPYEEQLLKVFNSHDRNNCGSLDREGLTQLCQTLQLEEHSAELIKCVLKDAKYKRASFPEFKDALLALLGNMQSKNVITDEGDLEKSPEREVSPKLVYGSKKYGRRSRPRIDEVTQIFNEDNDITINKSSAVQRSNSQSEVSNSKKRKTNYKLKRCTSLPGKTDLTNGKLENNFHVGNSLSCEPEQICTEDMLREAWKKLGVGEDGYLNQNELILVCDAIGLNKLADGLIRQLSDKLPMNYDQKISFQDVMEALREDETWFEVLNTVPTNNNDSKLGRNADTSFPDSRTFQYVTLGPDGNGLVSADSLIEMWETVGIHSPKELLHELGFDTRNINILDLAQVLEKQTKIMNDTSRTEYQSPHLVLLQATLTLYQSEIRCLKHVLGQMHAEREKLKCDVVEANNRSTLLAQEVDDNHSRMEQNTLNQVKLLEQRHADILKEVTQQYSRDKDQLTNINLSLEEKIVNLEQEVLKLKNDLAVAQKYSLNLEKENRTLSNEIVDLKKDKEMLTIQINALENENQKFGAMEYEEHEMLIAKLAALQIENAQLKDKNDEMVSEIESLTNQVASMRSKVCSTPTFNTLDQSMEGNISIIVEGVNVGAKRRSDYSPTKDKCDGSPRLGKLRRKTTGSLSDPMKGQDNLELPLTSSESGFETEADCLDSSISASEHEEIARLQAKVAFLEQVLVQNAIPVPDTLPESPCSLATTLINLTERVRDLETIIFDAKASLKRMVEKKCVSEDNVSQIRKKLENIQLESIGTNIDDSFDTEFKSPTVESGCQTEPTEDKSVNIEELREASKKAEEKNKELSAANKELEAKIVEYENCLELLRNEMVQCEDYWETKIDEERQIFEQEHKLTSDTLTDLLVKLKEYEDQFASQDQTDNRLPPIVETENLEKQFTDLEQEYEDYKNKTDAEIFRKDEEISVLREQLEKLMLKADTKDAEIQANESVTEKMKTFTSYIIEQSDYKREEQDENVWEQSEQPIKPTTLNWNFNENAPRPLSNVPSTSSSSNGMDKNTTPCRPKRTRKHDKHMYKKKEEVKKCDKPQNAKPAFNQDVVMPASSYYNLNNRRHYLEQRVKSLEMVLTQQHYHHEHVMQQYFQQFRADRAEYQCKLKFLQEKLEQQVRICNDQLQKLERTDQLVKEMYVENSYLIANVQRLEQQCHIMKQCSANSSTV
ncbi:ninein isoform X2 [Aethina tumida]|nr:ninein isoform X2 [Aethina tumida]